MRFGPVHILEKTNVKGSRVLMALHWRYSYTWRWLLWVYLPSGFKFRWMWHHYPYGVMAQLITPLGELYFQTQSNVWRTRPCRGDKTELDEILTGHRLHCGKCDVHLTSLYLCPKCGYRYETSQIEREQ